MTNTPNGATAPAAEPEPAPPPKASAIDLYRQQVLPAEKAEDLWRSLPSHISPAIFERNLTNALMANPDLLRFDARLVYREVSKAAGLGLLLDPQLGEAYIVVAYNYKTKRQEPQLRIGYRGMSKLARQTGNVAALYTHEVCEADHVECDLGHPKVLHHVPKLFGDRGAVIGYLSVISYKDSFFDFEPMSVEQTRAIRDRSDAWKAFVDKKIKSTPWSTDEDEMAKKTTLRRLLKRQDLSPEMRRAIEIEDRAEFPEMARPTLRVIGGGGEDEDDDGPPPPPPPGAPPPPSPAPAAETSEPIGEAEALELAESGRFEPVGDVVWGDADEPPAPEPEQPKAYLTKAELLAGIDKITKLADSGSWANRTAGDVGNLSVPDRKEVMKAFNDKTTALKRDGK